MEDLVGGGVGIADDRRIAVALLRSRIEPSGGPPPTMAGSGHVAVGEPEEDRREDWRRWADFFRAYVS